MEKFLRFLGKLGGKTVDFVVFVKDKTYEVRLKVRKVKTRRELGAIAKNSKKIISESEVLAIEGLLKAHNIRVRDVMLDIESVVLVDVDELITPKLMDDLYKTEQKVFLTKSEEEISGLVTLSDIIDLKADGKKIKKVARFLPSEINSEIPILEALKKFSEENSSVLIVVDEFGKQIGLVRLEDVLKKMKLASSSKPRKSSKTV